MEPNHITRRSALTQRGAALLIVIWTIALISSFTVTIVTLTYRDTLSAKAEHQAAHYRNLADSALAMTLWRLLDNDPSLWPKIDGQFHPITVLDHQVLVRITDDEGKIDLNRSSDSVLEAYLNNRFGSSINGWQIVQQLRDWQDPDDITRPGGAERMDYLMANRSILPRNAPMESTDEILLLLAAQPELLKCALEDFTVSSPTGFISRNVASRKVAAAMDTALGKPNLNLLSDDSSKAPLAPLGRVLTIDINIHHSDSVTQWRLSVTGRLTGEVSQPYQIVARKSGYTIPDIGCDDY